MEQASEALVILDYGSQYTQLIARRARELGVFSVIVSYDASVAEIQQYKPKGIVLSGGPSSVFDRNAPRLNKQLFELGVPILGICYGLQLLAYELGGVVEPSTKREYGLAKLTRTDTRSLLLGAKSAAGSVWMSHGTSVTRLPEGFVATATSDGIIAVAENSRQKLFGFQFHPEVSHSTHGRSMLKKFLDICGFGYNWTTEGFITSEIKRIKAIVGKSKVICALSGGVDSSIAATLVDRAVGAQQTCIFVDNGLLRQNEFEEILETYKQTGLNVKPIRAAEKFLAKLAKVTDPEKKRKIIGGEFIRIFEAEAKKIKDVQFLVQGTLYPDVITSGAIKGSAVIKSHHNVGGLPKKMKLRLIEPLCSVFKDEVRLIGAELGLPEKIVKRQPFPGPGLAVRIVGAVTPERLNLLRQADAIVREEIESRPEIRNQLYHYFTVLLPINSVGVMGDSRTYEQVIAIKALTSDDIMTADWARLPYDVLARMSSRIVAEVRGINRVVYEITTKPPATIEWE